MSGTLTINLGAIQANWRLIANRLAEGAEAAAVVKANAYGLGLEPVAKALYAAGCRTYFVAIIDEALELKQYLDPECRIFILTGVRPADIPACVEANFIPVLASLAQCQQWAAGCQQLGTQAFSAVKVDSGMHRLGMDAQEFNALLNDDKLLLSCSPVMLMSHLACAELPDHPLNQQQLQRLREDVAAMRERVPNIAVSLANSSGVFLGADYHFNCARPGVSLYGVNPTPHLPNPMQPVVTVKLPILQTKTVTGPAAIGYDATFNVAAGEQRRIAICGGGYADGVFVHLSNKGAGMLAGRRVPMVGRVSMDTTIFDISDIDDAVLASDAGQHIMLIDQHHDVDQVAQEAGTIGYEVLTALGCRYRREYIE